MGEKSRDHLPQKIPDLRQRVKDCLATHGLRYTQHALDEMEDDDISHMEIKQILHAGRHVNSKDFYDDEFQTWNYRFHGYTAGGERELGVVFSLEEKTGLLIITAFELSDGEKG